MVLCRVLNPWAGVALLGSLCLPFFLNAGFNRQATAWFKDRGEVVPVAKGVFVKVAHPNPSEPNNQRHVRNPNCKHGKFPIIRRIGT